MKKILALLTPTPVPSSAHAELKGLTAKITEVLVNKYKSYQTIQGLFHNPLQLTEQYVNLQMIYFIKESIQRKCGNTKKIW